MAIHLTKTLLSYRRFMHEHPNTHCHNCHIVLGMLLGKWSVAGMAMGT